MTSRRYKKSVSPTAATPSKPTRIILKRPGHIGRAEKNTSRRPNGTTKVQNRDTPHDSAAKQPEPPVLSKISGSSFALQPARASHGREAPSYQNRAEGDMDEDITAGRVRVKRHRRRRHRQHIIMDSSDEDSEPAQDVTTAQPPTPEVSETFNAEEDSILSNVIKSLTSIPTGEIAYGTGLVDVPLPTLELHNGSIVKYPYEEGQLGIVKDFAKQLRDKRAGIDWERIKRTPTWFIPGGAVMVHHHQWDKYFNNLARMAGKYLGFGTASIVPRLQGLYLWEEGSMWRDYHNDLYDPSRVGNLLIILNQDYNGGEIAIGCLDKEVFFDPSAAKTPQFAIASHNRSKHDCLPLTSGHRLGLVYDLRLDDTSTTAPAPDGNSTENSKTKTKKKSPSVYDLVRSLADAENDLFYHLACWAEELDTGARPPHPLLYVLRGTYEPRDMRLALLEPADRAKVLAVQALTREEYGERVEKYRLRGYLAAVTATVMSYGNAGGVGRRVNYVIDRAAGLEGELRSEVKGMRVGDKCVLQREEFETDVAREVYGGTMTARRTRTCLMLVLEKESK